MEMTTASISTVLDADADAVGGGDFRLCRTSPHEADDEVVDEEVPTWVQTA